MPIQKVITLYTYDELPTDKAKAAAREWWHTVDSFTDIVDYDDFTEICRYMGITLAVDSDNHPAIYWSGFSCQGDGASFEGTFSAHDLSAAPSITEYAPQDTTLLSIQLDLLGLVKRYPDLTSKITRYSRRYAHSGTMTLADVEAGNGGTVILDDYDEGRLLSLFRRLADWFYRNLEAEYEAYQSEEYTADILRINEYTFTEDGKYER